MAQGSAAEAVEAPLLSSSPATVPAAPRRNTFSFVCAMLASMTTILMGYNLALMSGAELFMREDLGLTDEQVEVLSGSMNVFMLASILAAGWAADLAGRRATLVLANAFLTAGALAMSLGGGFIALTAARFVTSLGAGFAVVATSPTTPSPGYLSTSAGAPCSPPASLPPRSSPPACSSPRWLAMSGRDGEAVAVLARTSDTPAEAGDRLEEIIHAKATGTDLGSSSSPITRRIFTNVLALQFFHQASGIDAIVLYSPLVFQKSGMSSNTLVLGATVAVGIIKTCSIFVATLLSDRVGRRPLLLASTAGVAGRPAWPLTLTSLAATLSTFTTPTTLTMAACFASVLSYVAAFSVGLGPLTQAYSAEILPLRMRARGAGLGTAVNRLTCGVLSMTFISLANSVGMAGCFFLYAGLMLLACVFVYVRLPETRGRSLEDMDVLFSS
ncbi:hypothetical protein PR202_ga22565 [Eleusine coracana subsp. coracana]|uniref:Major facilitator superfamily (MFS) profile domain-containing protein n=1 Tax=Eleusine coracana subsp. coracana TaxID=191504 RepID=A0AAV5D225_ELECO|nr:hypothetical protein PR202_ga22565 [Eleusine coracana subsp. coracana]